MPLHFPVFMPVGGTDEIPLVRVNDEMTDCLPVFTSRELAEMYVAESGGGLNLYRIDHKEGLSSFVREVVRNHGVAHYAFNFTLHSSRVVCGTVWDLLEA